MRNNTIGFCGIACIPTNTTGILERFGKFITILSPGFNCYCCGIDEVYSVPNFLQHIENKTITKTRDDVIVTLTTSIQYQIKSEDAKSAFYSLQSPKTQIESFVDSCIRSFIPKMTLQELFESTDHVSANVKTELSNVMTQYGYVITNTLLTDIKLPENVQNAMNSKTEQLQLKLATIEKAEANKIAIVTKARAESEEKIISSNAKAESDRIIGIGLANKRIETAKGFETSANIIKEKFGVDTSTALNFMLTTQYIEMINNVGVSNKNTMMVPYPSTPQELLKNQFIQANNF